MSSLPKPASKPVAYGLLVFIMVIWASAFAGLRLVLREIDWVTLTMMRMIFASGALLVAGLLLGTPFPHKRDWWKVALTGLFGFTFYHLSLNLGLEYITAGQGAFIISTIPIWTSILAWQFLSENVTARTWAGMAVGLAGVGVISLDPATMSVSVGSFIVLFSAMCAGANIVIQKDLLKRYRALDVAVYATSMGTLPLLLWLPWSIEPLQGMSTEGWLVVAYLGLIPIGLGYFLYQVALTALEANRASQLQLLIPPIAAVIAWFWIGEEPGANLLIGGPIILAGVLLGNLERRRRRQRAPSDDDSAR
jgi:drug/metabolite transporter (DMT)-like permease